MDKTMVQKVFIVVFRGASLKHQKHILKMWAGVKMEYASWLELLKRLARDNWLVPSEKCNLLCKVLSQSAPGVLNHLFTHHGKFTKIILCYSQIQLSSCHNPDYKTKQKCRYDVCTKQSHKFRHLPEHITKKPHPNTMALLVHISRETPPGHFTTPSLASHSLNSEQYAYNVYIQKIVSFTLEFNYVFRAYQKLKLK